jgi:glycosyltransferase involved in cell wall biosynthesis
MQKNKINNNYIKQVMKKKKILLLSDDLRMPSGIANVSKQFVLGTVDKYDWVQLGAAINHPDEGKIFDLSEEIQKVSGVADANVKLYPFNGYGNPDVIRQLLMLEQPDAILHFTDPRYWIWLYDMEHEIRQSVPLLFYHIWDDLPDPKYNRDFYESCDWIGCISKQTYGITRRVWGWDREKHWPTPADWQVSYVPHGINPELYKPVEVPNEFKDTILKGKEYEFILYWNNRNIRRKQPVDVILAFDEFVKGLPEEKRDKVCLLMHTTPVEEHGTDLTTTIEHCTPDINVIFTPAKYSEEGLNWLYNMADVTINIASNEGFGLATAESVMAGTPIIVNVTGGLQDQCGFRDYKTGELYTADDYTKIGSLNDKRKFEGIEHGEWVTPIWPVRSTAGSIPTPYIFDDKVDFADVAPLIRDWYDMSREERKAAGLKGREWMLGAGGLSLKNMCDTMSKGIDDTFENWKPREKYKLIELS